MIRDDFDQIVQILDESHVMTIKQLQDSLQKVIGFIKKINQELNESSQEDKMQLIKMLSSMQKKLHEKIKVFCEHTGISEDQLNELSQNSSALNTQQKELIGSAEAEISLLNKSVNKYLHGDSSGSAGKKTGEKKKKSKSNWKKS